VTAPIPPIQGKTTVEVDQRRAFEAFTASINSWWPHQYHIGAVEVAEVVLEPRVGGRWYERGVDDSECDWGRVLAWEPPNRVLFTWQINGNWQFDPDPAHASEIEARFRPDGPDQTTVEVEHRHLERLVGGESVYGAIEHGGGGWVALLAAFAASLTGPR
jgi:uncharacterized protein YndB with AHSA1/START domain